MSVLKIDFFLNISNVSDQTGRNSQWSGFMVIYVSDLIKAYSGFIINFESELARRKEPQPSDSEVLEHIIA